MAEKQSIPILVFQAMALAMGVASLVLGILRVAPVQTHVSLLSIAVCALAVVSLGKN